MTGRGVLDVAWIVPVLAIVGALAAPARAAETVKISIPLMSADFAPFFVAQDKGYYAAEGLDVEFEPVSGGVSVPALISGSIDVSASSFTATVAILKGAPLKVVFVTQDRTPDQLWSFDPAVKSLKDLPGHVVAIATRGNSEEVNIRRALAQNGVSPAAVGFSAMGVGSARMSAVRSGAQRISILNALEQLTLRADGTLAKGTMLFDFSRGFQSDTGGLAVRDRDLAQHRDRIERILRATWQGKIYAEKFRSATLALLAKRFPEVAPKILAATYDSMRATASPTGELSPAAEADEIRAHAAVLALKSDAVPVPAKVYDWGPLDTVKAQLAAEHWAPAE